MKDLEQTATRYLLGELSESEQAALEERYFSDPEIFDQLTRVESDLVDDYVRGGLSAPVRQQFEQHYLRHPERRERVKFAEVLARRLDQVEESRVASAQRVSGEKWWQRLRERLDGSRLGPQLAFAALSSILLLGAALMFYETRRARQELAQTREALAGRQERERRLEQQIADERLRADQLASELERLRRQPGGQASSPSPGASLPAFVSFLITVDTTRGVETGPPKTLVIPRGAAEVRLQVVLKEDNYPSYMAVLQAVGGDEIFSRQKIRARSSRSGATFTLIVPASRFSTGDYILTLKAASAQGEVEEFSKSIFSVDKR